MNNIAEKIIAFTSIEEDLVSVDKRFDRAESHRTKMINLLTGILEKADIENISLTDSETIEAISSLSSSIGRLISDDEKAATMRVNAKVQKKNTESASDVSESIKNMFDFITNHPDEFKTLQQESSFIRGAKPHDIIDSEISKISEVENFVIPDTELRMDPTDIS